MKIKILLLLFSILVSLFVGEFLVRWLKLAPQIISLDVDPVKSGYKSSSNPILGYEFKPNYRDAHPTCGLGNFPAINSDGQRDIERIQQKPQGVKRILLLGDSVVAGTGLRNLDDTISRRLEVLLREKNVEVLNFGVPGYQTLAEVELLRSKGLKYSPDLVILVFDDSDFEPANRDLMAHDPQINGFLRWLFKNCHLFRWSALKMDLFGLRFTADRQYRYNYHRKQISGSLKKGIRRLRRLSVEHHFDVIVILWPRFSKSKNPVSWEGFYFEQGQVDRLRIAERFFKKYHLDTYRMVGYFMNDYSRRQKRLSPGAFMDSPNAIYTIGDTCHPNLYGAKLAAKSIYKILLKRHFI